MIRNREYEREIRHRRRKKRHKRGVFLLTASVVLLALGGGVFLYSLLNQPPAVLSVPGGRAEGEDTFSEGRARIRSAWEDTGEENRDGSLPDRELITGITERDSERENPGEGAADIEVDLSHLYSRCAVLTDFASGDLLAEHDARARIYPASLTKIMTAVLAVENTADMDEVVTVPEDIFEQLYAEDASMAGFLPGESAALRDLLYGILLPSGAECCMTFARRIAGSEAAFAELMNQKAEELGLADTHFCNATGLHDPDHYSTAEDIAALLRYALQSQTFREAFTGSRHSVPPSEKHPDGFTFVSTMFSYMDSAEVTGGRILGGKTGYTEEAGQCLASLAEVGGREYILVTAGAVGSHETEQFHILDAVNVYSQIGAGTAGVDGSYPTGADTAGTGVGTDTAGAGGTYPTGADTAGTGAGADTAGAGGTYPTGADTAGTGAGTDTAGAGGTYPIGADTAGTGAGADGAEDRTEYWWEEEQNG